MKKIIAVRPLDGFQLWLRFEDGIEGTADVSDLAGRGVFELWNDPKRFTAVAIDDFHGLVWSDQVDLCPDMLYLRVTNQRPEDLFPSLRKEESHA